MRIIDKARNLSPADVQQLLNEHGTLKNVVYHVAGKQNEQVRRTLHEVIKTHNLKRSNFNQNAFRYNKEDVEKAFTNAECWSDIYRSLGVTVCDHNKKAIIKFARHHGLTVPTFSKADIGRTFRRGKIGWTVDEIFCENSTYARSNVRGAVLRYNVLPDYTCSKCSLEPLWDGTELMLEIDHVNGISNDNRIENLRWLCPNCHSQTSTFKGKNR